jgi:hypothetical protein
MSRVRQAARVTLRNVSKREYGVRPTALDFCVRADAGTVNAAMGSLLWAFCAQCNPFGECRFSWLEVSLGYNVLPGSELSR